MNLFSTLLVCLFSATALLGQSTITEGYISYSVDVDSDEPAAAFLSVGTSLQVAFKGNRTKALATVGGGTGTVQVVVDHKAKKGLSLINMLGEKKAVKISESRLDEAMGELEGVDNPMRRTDDTKEIAGYTCQKILMKDRESGANIILYVTSKIKPANDPFAQLIHKELKGFPLQIIVRQDGTTVRLTADKVTSRTPSDGAFSLSIPEGYELVSEKELENTARQKAEERR